MTDHSSASIRQPKNWQDFERNARILFECILNDIHVQNNGRTGQPQHGVDIYGRKDSKGPWYGIQCKGKDAGYGKAVTEKELRSEVEKTRKFKPSIAHFILVTTAPADVTIQAVARTITEEREKEGNPLNVSVWGWGELESRIYEHRRALLAFEPDATPFTDQLLKNDELLIGKSDDNSNVLALILQTVQSTQQAIVGDGTSAVLEALDKHLHAEIDSYRDFIKDGRPLTALDRLEKMKHRVWESASDRIKFRLITNIGSAKLHISKEKEQEAVAHFLDAIQYQPEDKIALSNVVLAHLLRDETAEAITAARHALQLDSGNADAASYLIQAYTRDTDIDNPAELVPEHLRETASVQIACINFHRTRQNSQWVSLARDAAKQYPDNEQISRFAAEATLELTFSTQGLLVGEQPQKAVNAEELHAAAHTLRALWDKQINSELPAVDASLPYNLTLALKAIGDRATANRIVKQAVDVMPEASEFITFHASSCLEEGHSEEAIALLQKNERDAVSKLIIAEILADTDPAAVLKTLENFEEIENAEPRHRLTAAGLRVDAWLSHPDLSEENRISEAQKDCAAIEAQFPDSSLTFVIRATIHQSRGDTTAALQALHHAKTLIKSDTSFYDRFLLAKKFEALGNHSDAADLLDDNVNTSCDSPALRTLLLALIHSDRRRRAYQLLSSLPEEITQQPLFLRAALSLHLRRGDYHAAERAADRLLQLSPNDLHTHLNRIDLWLRRRNDAAVKHFLATDVEKLEGSAEEFMRLAHLLDRYGFYERALRLAYRILLENRRQATIQLSYMGLLLRPGSSETISLDRKTIGLDTAFSIKNERGETETFVIEENEELRLTDETISPSHEFATVATGLCEGEKFIIADEEWEIVSIKHKYLHALHTKMEHFERHFPQNGGLRRVIVEDDQGVTNVEPMLQQIKQRHDVIEHVFSVYDEQPLPLEIFSNYLGTDVIEAWYGLAQTDHKFKVCYGNLAERHTAMEAIEANEVAGCVVDALTLHIIRTLGVEDAVIKICGSIAATESTVDIFRLRREQILSYRGQPYSTVFWRDGQFFREEVTQEQLENMLARIEQELDWIEQNVEILPAESTQIIPEDANRIKDEYSHSFLDPLLAAQESGKLLLCEDQSYRQFGVIEFKVQASWLQPVLMRASETGMITQSRYSDAIYSLVAAGHNFTSLDAGILLHVARDMGKQFGIVANTLLTATADLDSHGRVIREFFQRIWDKNYPPLNEQRATSFLLRRLCFGEWLKNFPDATPYEALSRFSDTFSNPYFENYLRNWQIGHVVPIVGYKQDALIKRKNIK